MSLSNRNISIDKILNNTEKQVLREILQNAQDRQLSLLNAEPGEKDIDERELKTYVSGDNNRLFSKQDGSIVSFLGTIADSTETGDVMVFKDITDGSLKYTYVESGLLKISSTKP